MFCDGGKMRNFGWPIHVPSFIISEVPEQEQLDAAKAGVQFVLPSSGMTDMDFTMYEGCILKFDLIRPNQFSYVYKVSDSGLFWIPY